MDAQILIIGGGPAGLTTAGALKQVGLESTILDAGEGVGHSWQQRYDRLHLHTVRDYSGLAHFPISLANPKYLSKDQYARYLCDYAAHFGLQFTANARVTHVRQTHVDGRPGWAVDAGPETWTAPTVVIAAGPFGQPVCPSWPGLSGFGGKTLHSASYHSGQEYAGQRVLVIGAGNSGMEIAADLAAGGAAKVAVSVRSAPPIVPRDFLGVPAQVFGIWMNPLPPAFSDRIARLLSRLALGDLRRYGLPAAAWGPFSSKRTPVIDVGFVAALKAGQVSVRSAVQSFTSTGVAFSDGRTEPFDTVLFATGFRSGLEQLLEPQGLLDSRGNPRFGSGASTDCPGLYFMGYFDSLRGFLYESNLASRRLAREISRKV